MSDREEDAYVLQRLEALRRQFEQSAQGSRVRAYRDIWDLAARCVANAMRDIAAEHAATPPEQEATQ